LLLAGGHAQQPNLPGQALAIAAPMKPLMPVEPDTVGYAKS
jgi:hypothetical protein